MSSLSVIIPTLEEERHLTATVNRLRSVLGDAPHEIIVVDGGSRDRTVAIARALGCRLHLSKPGRSVQLNAGARAANGKLLLFLHADTLAPKNLRHFLNVKGPATFRLVFSDAGGNFWLWLFGFCTRFRGNFLRFGDQGLLLPKDLFWNVGGYREDFLLLEDNELIVRLGNSGQPVRVLPTTVRTSARRYRQNGVFFTQSVYALLYLGYRLGVSQRRLVAIFNRAFDRGSKGAGSRAPALLRGAGGADDHP